MGIRGRADKGLRELGKTPSWLAFSTASPSLHMSQEEGLVCVINLQNDPVLAFAARQVSGSEPISGALIRRAELHCAGISKRGAQHACT